MSRKRLTQVFPFLLPFRKWQRKKLFYLKMQLDGNKYAKKTSENLLPNTVFETSSLMLKEKGIAVFFEDENINTLTMDGELLLVVLSSVAQQEVENISSNVKKGLKMKMKRGELVGFQGCLGYLRK